MAREIMETGARRKTLTGFAQLPSLEEKDFVFIHVEAPGEGWSTMAELQPRTD